MIPHGRGWVVATQRMIQVFMVILKLPVLITYQLRVMVHLAGLIILNMSYGYLAGIIMVCEAIILSYKVR